LLRRAPLRSEKDAKAHTLLDVGTDLPLFRYFRDAPRGGDRLRFGKLWRLGSGEAIRRMVLAGRGVAVLPLYMVAEDLRRGRLLRVFPSVPLLFDHFRLVFRL